MEAKIVVGLGYGDEGKGITTDYLSSHSPLPSIVIRYSGGQQAGHTVVKNGKRHIYATFACGTGSGLPTYISEYCTFYPPFALNEYITLVDKGIIPSLYIHPLARLTSYWDVAWGRFRERIVNHGSCGMGVGATMHRHEQSPYKLFVIDLTNKNILKEKLNEMGRYYWDRVKDSGCSELDVKYFREQMDANRLNFERSLDSGWMKYIIEQRIHGYHRILSFNESFIFEGSQGVLLDMDHGVFPNVTYSNTTSKNALNICKQMGIKECDTSIYYVTRCYLTRHGNGWLPSDEEIMLINNSDETNISNEWQKDFKIRELDLDLLQYALKVDKIYSTTLDKNLVVTCLDQRPDFSMKTFLPLKENFTKIMSSWSPDSQDFKEVLF